jgi:hypothetical protein
MPPQLLIALVLGFHAITSIFVIDNDINNDFNNNNWAISKNELWRVPMSYY